MVKWDVLKKEIAMALCFRCGAETQLHDNDVPVCIACVDTPAVQSKPTRDAKHLPNDTQLGLSHD
jgi:hypothetical protein